MLADLVVVHDLADGEVLLAEGSTAAELHVVVSGLVSVTKADEHGVQTVLQQLRPGDLVGELSFMDGRARYAALVASGPTRVFTLSRERFETLIEREPRVVYKTMRAIMTVAHEVQRRLSVQMAELQHYIYKTGGKY